MKYNNLQTGKPCNHTYFIDLLLFCLVVASLFICFYYLKMSKELSNLSVLEYQHIILFSFWLLLLIYCLNKILTWQNIEINEKFIVLPYRSLSQFIKKQKNIVLFNDIKSVEQHSFLGIKYILIVSKKKHKIIIKNQISDYSSFYSTLRYYNIIIKE